MAFFPPYLRGLGLSGRQVSMMLAVAPTMNLGMPLAWGYLADRLRRPDLRLRLVTLGAFLFLLPLIVVQSMPGLLLCYVGHQSFAVAIVGLCDSIALEQVRRGADYGRIRLWGSLSFAVACLLIGPGLAARHAAHSPVVPALMAAALGCTFFASLGVRGEGGERARPH